MYNFLKFLGATQGMCLPLTRVCEPTFFYQVKKKFACGCRKSAKTNPRIDRVDTLDSGDLEVKLLHETFFDKKERVMSTASAVSRVSTSELASASSVSEKDTTNMAPMFLFLASSFNTELVYIILKSITQFAYLSFDSVSAETDEILVTEV